MINILWIDDNPLIQLESTIDRLKQNLNKVTNLKGDLAEYYNLIILQHPKEIKQYLEACSSVSLKYGSAAFAKVECIVPDIIIFDYNLSQNFGCASGNQLPYTKDGKVIRVAFNPIYKMVEKYPELFRNISIFSDNCMDYSEEDFFKEVNNKEVHSKVIQDDINKTRNDDFGLYAGISILRFFKEHISCALPATFKSSKSQLETTSKYFEWLNEYDLKSAFSRENRSDKNWNTVLAFGTELLRKRILEQAKQGKVQFNLDNLISIRNRVALNIEINTSFTTKELSLKALFFNTDGEQVKELAKEFATDILNIIIKDLDIYVSAKKIADDLWKTYQSPITSYRLQLSELSVRQVFEVETQTLIVKKEEESPKPIKEIDKLLEMFEKFKLSEKEQTYLISLNKYFKVANNEVTNDAINYGDFKLITEGKSKEIKRLVVFFTIIQLVNKYLNFITTNVEINELELMPQNIGALVPNPDDLLIALYPVAKEPVMLPVHLELIKEFTEKPKSKVEELLTNPLGQSGRALNIQVKQLGFMLDFSNLLDDAEFSILSNYTNTNIEKELINSSECPQWLKNLSYGIHTKSN